MIIEDNQGDFDLLKRMLEGTEEPRLTTRRAPNLATALLQLSPPLDLILLDLGLPDSQGVETVRKVRAAVSDTPIIVLSGMEDRSVSVECLANGAQDYLVKGLVDRRLLRQIVLRTIKPNAASA